MDFSMIRNMVEVSNLEHLWLGQMQAGNHMLKTAQNWIRICQEGRARDHLQGLDHEHHHLMEQLLTQNCMCLDQASA